MQQTFNTLGFCSKLKALSHPHRLRIVQNLLQGECNVSQMQASLGLPQPSISSHLARLRTAGIIEGTRHGQEIRYRVVDGESAALVQTLLREEGR